MSDATFSQTQLLNQLKTLGIEPRGVLVVHCAFSIVKPVEGGPRGLIAALEAALKPEGTLVMPSMSYDDDQVFDPKTSSAVEMGVVADTFWRLPHVLRSNSPHAFAAAGRRAAQITAPHPADVPHGLDSPIGRAYELDGQVLLLGVGHGSNTTVHLGEYLAGVRYRREKYVTVLSHGKPERLEYREIDHCCQNFDFVDQWLDERGLQRRGTVGYADARLARCRDIIEVVVEHLKADETVFLHPKGIDEECDDARASLEIVK